MIKKVNYEHPRFNEIKREVQERFDQDFHYVQLQNLQKIDEFWFESVIYPEMEDPDDEEAREEIDTDIMEIIWNTLFEASDNLLADKLVKNASKLYDNGITVIDVRNTETEDYYNTGVFLGMRGCGYDFFEAHWIPLYTQILEWVNVED